MQQRQVLIAGFFGFLAVWLCLLAASQVQAASGNGPYYAEPSWSQKLPAATRFVVLTDWNNEAVLDRNTGLVWERSPETAIWAFENARRVCLNRAVGGQMGWRLPSIPELMSLVDPSVASPGPTLPPGHPFTNTQALRYWSATRFTAEVPRVWTANFESGHTSTLFDLNTAPIWCVRGGMNADAY